MSDENRRGRLNGAPEEFLSAAWRRLNEHRVAQWTVGYVAVAYGIQHAVVLTGEAFEWPQAVQRISMLLLALGVPLVMALAWYHGHSTNRRVSGAELSIISILLVGVSLLFYVFVRPSAEAESTPAVREAGVVAARAAAASPKGAISLAVLPFADLSPEKNQEYFSDGMTDEIGTALAKIADLRVVARESAFQFKGEKKDVRAIGQSLGATHVIEGSVRKAGNRVRISAELVKTDDGLRIWAENYDRELTDVFAIQEDVARAIAASLHMTLPLKPGENLVNNRAIDSESYEKYLRARALLLARGGEPTVAQEIRNSTEALTLAQAITTKNPDYAPGWRLLAGAYVIQLNQRTAAAIPIADARRLVEELRPKAEAANQRALQLDPNLTAGNSGLGYLMRSRGKLVEAEEQLKKALALDPSDSGALFNACMIYGAAGRIKEASEFCEKGHTLDPLSPALALETVQMRWVNGQDDAAIALAKTLRLNDRAPLLAMIYGSQHRYGEAADALMDLANYRTDLNAAKAARLLRMLPQKLPAAGELPQLGPRTVLETLYLYLGAPERTLTSYEQRADMGYIQGYRFHVWHPSFSPVRKTDQFKALMRKVGLVDYWRAKGWPPQCHPTTGDDFACE